MSASPPIKPSLADFWRDLPSAGRRLLSVIAIQFIGTGLIIPFAVVYLHSVRGFDLGTSGLLLGIPPLVGFVVVGPGGALIDRLGARAILVTSLAVAMVADVLLAGASTIPLAAGALVLNGVGQGLSWPAANTLVGVLIPEEQRQRYFGVNFTLLNLGIGIGGLIGGIFVDVHHLWTFQAIYLVDAFCMLPPIAVLLSIRHVARPPRHHDDLPVASYLEVIRRPAVPTLLILGFMSAFVGYGQLNSGMTAFASTVADVSTHTLGLAFAANTAVIVVLQLVVLQRIEGRRRTRIVGLFAAVWAVSWLALGAAGLIPGSAGAAVLVCLMCAIFGVGETLMQPTLPAIVNDLADDRARGRFNALSSATYQLPSMIAPPIAGALIGAGLGWAYIALLLIGCVLVAWLAIARLEPQLSPRVNGLRIAAEAVGQE